MNNKKQYFRAKEIITPPCEIQDGLIGIQGGRIIHLGNFNQTLLPPDSILSHFPDKIIIPGLIDIHIHGFGGYGGYGLSGGAGIISHEMLATDALSRLLPKHGVTSFLPTISANHGEIESIIHGIKRACELGIDRPYGARILGINLEGPFLNPSSAGALNARNFCLPSKYLLEKWYQQSSGKLAIITLAPELPGGNEIITLSKELGIVPAIGHSRASYEIVKESVRLGLNHVTHAFNAMKGFHHRHPGIVGGLLVLPELTAELISDGWHLHPAAIQLLLLTKGWEKLIIISDSTPWGGLPDGRYSLSSGSGGEEIIVRKGKGSLKNGRLVGSLSTIREGVMRMVAELHIPISRVLAMASLNPARLLKLDKEIGSLEIGKKADFVVVDESLRVKLTVIDGRVVYKA